MGLLKRFNVTIDVEAEVMRLYPLDRPELLVAGIDRGAVAADIPLYLFDATTVEASMAGSPPGLHILDSAAGTNLVDRVFLRNTSSRSSTRRGSSVPGRPAHLGKADAYSDLDELAGSAWAALSDF